MFGNVFGVCRISFLVWGNAGGECTVCLEVEWYRFGLCCGVLCCCRLRFGYIAIECACVAAWRLHVRLLMPHAGNGPNMHSLHKARRAHLVFAVYVPNRHDRHSACRAHLVFAFEKCSMLSFVCP